MVQSFEIDLPKCMSSMSIFVIHGLQCPHIKYEYGKKTESFFFFFFSLPLLD